MECQLIDFVDNMGITLDSFVSACELASSKVHKAIVNQILAVDNFVIFKKMMVARNKQLNLQALRQMQETMAKPEENEEEEEDEEDDEEAQLALAIEESNRLQKEVDLKRATPVVFPPTEITKPVIASITSQPLPSLGGHSKGLASDFEDINLEEQKFDANREERLKSHRDILMKSKQESRLKELQTYQASQSPVDEDEQKKKQELIKKGMAAMAGGAT